MLSGKPGAVQDFDEHVDMVPRERTINDGDVHFGTHLPDDVAHPDPDPALEHLVAVLWRPDEVVAMVKNCVTAGAVGHSLYPRESGSPTGQPTFPRIQAIKKTGWLKPLPD